MDHNISGSGPVMLQFKMTSDVLQMSGQVWHHVTEYYFNYLEQIKMSKQSGKVFQTLHF